MVYELWMKDWKVTTTNLKAIQSRMLSVKLVENLSISFSKKMKVWKFNGVDNNKGQNNFEKHTWLKENYKD